MNDNLAKLAERYAQLPLAAAGWVIEDCAAEPAGRSVEVDPAAVEQLAARKLAELSSQPDSASG